ncbi:unnamed protein product [Malus baccata var. baccata]
MEEPPSATATEPPSTLRKLWVFCRRLLGNAVLCRRRRIEGSETGWIKVRPEEDDLVTLLLEALLAEKSGLANENSNLVRENQCLHQVVEYHQLTSQDLSASSEQVVQGLCLDFSSPPRPTAGEANGEDGDVDGDAAAENKVSQALRSDLFGFSAS